MSYFLPMEMHLGTRNQVTNIQNFQFNIFHKTFDGITFEEPDCN